VATTLSQIERGVFGEIPYASVGSGRPVVIAAGGWPTTGVDSDRLVTGAIAPLRLVHDRRLIVLNRRRLLPTAMSLSDLAGEYAQAIRTNLDTPVDLVGTSTGGSIVQQLSSEHPEVVRRLVLVSSACRLGPAGRRLQADVARELRDGRVRTAASSLGAALAPAGLRAFARTLAWAAGPFIIPDADDAADLATTLEAEDDFDLKRCEPIRAPTLIVAGGRDRFYPPELFAETAALIPTAHLEIFARRGHLSVAADRRARATIAGFLSWPDA
jgi:pimeloyl-ACP methyl ester carboxylesterase